MATTTWPAEIYVFDGTHWVSISPHGMTTLPPATGTTIGGVIVGSGVNVAPDGTISVTHFSGDYNDLTNKPVIQAPVQSDWLATGGDAFIVNKPNYLSQFTNDLSVSAFPNDALYVDAAAAAAAAPIQSIAAGANVAITDDGHGNIVIAATGGGGGTPGGGVVSVSGTAPIKVVDGLNAPVISLVLGAGLKVNSGALEADFSGLATVATSGSYNDLSDKPTIPPAYTLPTASGTVLGGVKVGTGLTMTGEVLSATGTTVPDASTTTKGIIQIADAANITAGTALRAVDAAGLKTVTDQQTKDFVNVSGDTMTGALVIPDGTAAAPSLKFDDATGIYQPAANTWAVSTGGVERLVIDSQGRIGINAYTSSFTPSYRFHINEFGGTEFFASSQYFYVRQESDKEIGFFWINNNSAGSSSRSIWGLALDSGGGNANGLTVWASSVGPSGDPKWTFTKDSGIVAKNTNGYLQTGLGTAAAPSVALHSDTDTGIFSPGANTWAVSTGGIERLRVTSNGRVGIGVDPTPFGASFASLVVGDGSGSEGMTIYSSVQGTIAFGDTATTGAASYQGYVAYVHSSDYMAFGTAGSERLRIQSDGKVSIGSPNTQSSASLLIRRVQDASAVIQMDGAAPAGAGSYYGVLSAPAMAGASNSTYSHFTASESGTGDFAVSYGFLASDSLSGTIEARGFVSSLSAGAGRWNIYASGTASNYFAGQIQVGSGSALAPAICHAGDTDTGTFSPAANTFAISTAGTERLRINASGYLGVGANPSWFLDVGATTSTSARIRNKNAGGQAKLRMENGDGNFFDIAVGVDHFVIVPSLGGGLRITNAGQICSNSSTVGTASSPSYSYYNDTDTGTFSPAANTFAVSTAGTERLRVKSTGGVRYVPLAAAPTTPEEGEVYFDSTTKKLRVYDGTGWVDLN